MSKEAITFSMTLDHKEPERKLEHLKQKIKELEKSLFEQKQQQLPLEAQVRSLGVALDEAKWKLESARNSVALFSGQDLSTQAAQVRQIQMEFQAAKAAIEACNAKIKEGTRDLDALKEKAGDMEQQLAEPEGAAKTTGEAIEKAGARMDKFKERLASTLGSKFVFGAIHQALAKFSEWMGKAIQVNGEATAALARLKGALLTLVQPLVNILVPAFTFLVNVLARVVAAVATVVSMLFGTTAEESSKGAEALYEETDALNATGAAAKKAGGQLANFDEINKLSGGTDSAGGISAEPKPDFSLFETDQYKSKLDEIAVYVSGALLALGAILALSGINIPLGLGLMAAGALELAAIVAENWGALSDGLKGALTCVAAVLGGAALVVGAILAFSGTNVPMGIALMAVGAAGLATAVALNWEAISQALQGPIGALVAIASGCLLGIGLLLAFSGTALPLGIALIVAGAGGLATTAALNWDAIITALQGPLGETVALASGFLLALGLVLALSGAALPLGIALIAAGAAGLATVVALNWESITTALQGPMGKMVALASGAMLVLGLILALSGAGLPLGIALMAAGAAGLVTVSALNWNAILDKLKEVWGAISSWWSANVAPKFTLAYWKEVFSSIKEGLVSKIKDALNSAIGLFNSFIDWVNNKLNLSWKSFSLFGKEIIPAGSFQLLTIPHIPMLAQGAVIPPNREFMAVLGDQRSGTNIETPEGLLRQIFREESGNGAVIGELREILAAIREGKVMTVDRREIGKIVQEAMASSTRSGLSTVPVR